MQIIFANDNIKLEECVVALGNFDGVHKGHTALIKKAKEKAEILGLPLCVYTFWQHPSSYFKGENILITNNSEKEKILESLDVDILYYEDFSEICDMSAESFCKDILLGKLSCSLAVCGENFTFGKGGAGTSAYLADELAKLGSVALVVDFVDESGTIISSSSIREHILRGEMERAAELLGRPFSIYYPVSHGRHLGTQMGIPTINQAFEKTKLKPKCGVYACLCYIDGKKYMGVADVGKKPTVTKDTESAPVLCETHIVDFSGDLYGKSIKIDFYTRLRDEKKFDSLGSLILEIQKNIRQTREYFKNEKGFANDEN